MDLRRCLELVGETVAEAGGPRPTEPVAAEAAAVLELTRAIAHAAERTSAPIGGYAVGIALAGLPPESRAAIIAQAAARIDEAASAGTG